MRTITRTDDLALIRAVAAGEPVRIASEHIERIGALRARALRAVHEKHAVYGINTGMGKLSTVRLTEAQQKLHQRNLLLARAVGGPPWLERDEARAVLVTRLLTFLTGDAAVSAELCQRLVADLNEDIVPAIPRDGMGVAGEVTNLAHAFGPLAGIGHVLGAAGQTLPASGGFRLGPKEGVALIQGVPGATALATLRLASAAALTGLMTQAAALSIVAVRAPRDPYHPVCARGDDVHAQVLAGLRELAGDEPDPRSLQAPVSFRVIGPVLANVARAAAALEAAVVRALVTVTDSPAFVDGRFTGTAGFHGIDLSAHCDQLTAAVCHAAEVAAARIHRLMDPAVTGLSAQLASDPGPEAGLSPLHKRATGEVHAMRRLTAATASGLIETSAGQEDVQSFAWEATEKLSTAIRHCHVVTACELLAARQAVTLSGQEPPLALRSVTELLRIVVPPIDGDRPFGEDLERIIRATPLQLLHSPLAPARLNSHPPWCTHPPRC